LYEVKWLMRAGSNCRTQNLGLIRVLKVNSMFHIYNIHSNIKLFLGQERHIYLQTMSVFAVILIIIAILQDSGLHMYAVFLKMKYFHFYNLGIHNVY
jgi:hypothetical protein